MQVPFTSWWHGSFKVVLKVISCTSVGVQHEKPEKNPWKHRTWNIPWAVSFFGSPYIDVTIMPVIFLLHWFTSHFSWHSRQEQNTFLWHAYFVLSMYPKHHLIATKGHSSYSLYLISYNYFLPALEGDRFACQNALMDFKTSRHRVFIRTDTQYPHCIPMSAKANSINAQEDNFKTDHFTMNWTSKVSTYKIFWRLSETPI